MLQRFPDACRNCSIRVSLNNGLHVEAELFISQLRKLDGAVSYAKHSRVSVSTTQRASQALAMRYE